MKRLVINDISIISTIANEFLTYIGNKRVIAFYGSMGAGKTTFIKAICEQLNTKDIAVSPTFAIINEYEITKDESVFHFDMYRIEKVTDAVNIGTLEYFDSGNYCFIEWPEMIEDILPEDCLRVNLFEENGKRVVEFNL
ncbi:MAG TPA: tRNA (adenosine(37)-N6)-threonylcarbamoyltransferase complex ATPase subunit type 1 TsaE [Bacteroidales bacterium]|nr:MAG: tRNA (adenosine(37)-N6)-threonylcarbamoyltransferase complex ATPase subunit type 1 TsaE [Bacteroidetes bacterium GWF2_33_38]OFY76697.1 MAG: tRNA (adenosine(37)-N6)-threonylcarbamoyltransferase complex ATPase subunit type 1 TsaE [Bacteroidetes bacterium RIFOXYA12_FULL_33_9]OFY84870.1 MAG: tRNA (adenosine(37)-N6)-threonylcarbamoyltransferase complex ATPase subunit type 1 TsaE [Bacteroidetes bacterium RIFOXYA2_FULL_33_7]HBF87528.1 tRNA (adenosine(37)-N6)-threonylcarbamoyltransferase complex